MISILIPVFNTEVYPLVQELTNQLKSLATEGEIVVYDDCSEPAVKNKNRSAASFDHVVYKELNKNNGRAIIRQLLAKDARFDWLLFIDSDSVIINKKFLGNYFNAIRENNVVYTGGRKYQQEQPADCRKRLHWLYGTERESKQGSKNVLHSNNFCIRKEVFLALDFPVGLTGYGHEDTWMELSLWQRQNKIEFIDNAVLHDGLEDAEVFLEKTKNAQKNLLLLPEFFDETEVRKKIRLYQAFYWIKRLGLSRIVGFILNRRMNKIEKVLHSCNPSLFFFDLYRIFHLVKMPKAGSFKN